MATSLLRHNIRKALLSVNLHQDNFLFYSSVVAKDLNATKLVSNEGQIDTNSHDTVEYPPVKPKYPPGQWGNIEPSYAWLWQNTTDELLQTPDVKGRQDLIINKEMSYINTLPYYTHPDYLKFAKYATKSILLPWSEINPTVAISNQSHSLTRDSSTIDMNREELVEKVKKIVADQLLIELEVVERASFSMETCKSSSFSEIQAGLVMRCIFDTLTTILSGQINHLRTCQYDEDVIVRAVWDRHGIERRRKHRLSPSNDHFKIQTVLDQRLMSSCTFNGMIRSHLPLPQFEARDSRLTTNNEIAPLKYHYSSYGVPKNGTNRLKSILAGHILGDPCEYGLVGYLLTNKQRELDNKFGHQVAKECRLGRGLTSTFTWLAAQAYNQGFSGFIDLTYPLTSQTVMSDGKNFSFMACQLNTLELWKPDSANNMTNLCWYTDEMSLFDCIENGQVKGFNDDVLKTLIQVFMLEPADRGYDMKPTISEKDINLHEKHDFIPMKIEEVVEKKEEQYIV